jgi:hypothetical protein
VSSSMFEHSTVVPVNPVESTVDTRYVNGEMRYMKIQKRGISDGLASTLDFQSVIVSDTEPADHLPVEDQA